ncbi:MAG: paraquat-inducible protein A [Pseudomonadota bacterium]
MRTATDAGFIVCRSCGTLSDRADTACTVCGATVRSLSRDGLQAVWAYWLAGVLAYIPGNVLPIMVTQSLSGVTESTIMGGVITLLHHGSYGIAAVIFIASIGVPVAKFIVIAWLALSIQHGWSIDPHRQHRAHQAIELIGRWSMIDVFVVAALAALIQIGGLMSITPGVGVNAFAMSVVLTMFSAMSLDARLIWMPTDDHTRTSNDP